MQSPVAMTPHIIIDSSALKRVKVLQGQIVRIRAANQAYLHKRSHSRTENVAQQERELRLQDIKGELIHLARTMKAA